jgi:PiT family inorganic phosphate transporter
MVLAPMIGMVVGFLIMFLLMRALRRLRPRLVHAIFGKAQLLSASWMSFEHGRNDAQETMGVITLTLFAATTQSNAFAHLPSWLGYLKHEAFAISTWVKVICALTAAAVIGVATHWVMPLSTTHVVSSSIIGVGATKGTAAVKWALAERMVWAWIMTIPITAVLGHSLLLTMQVLGWSK